MTIRGLVVEDDAVAAEAHCTYLRRLDGFEVATMLKADPSTATIPIRAKAFINCISESRLTEPIAFVAAAPIRAEALRPIVPPRNGT